MEKHRKKIEEYGDVMEKMGLAPVASRVFGYLLLAGDEGAAFDDLVAFFGVSKSAISNALKMLTATGMASSRTSGGQRKRSFYVNLKGLFNEQMMTQKYVQFFSLLDDARKVRNVQDVFANDLEDVAVLYKMLLVEFPIVLERWRRTIELKRNG